MQLKQITSFVAKALIFTVTLVFFYLLIVFALCEIKVSGRPLIYRACQGLVWKGGYTYERFKEFHPDKKYDVLIFGSSRANRGINTHVFDKYGFSSYNLGTDDQTPVNSYTLIRQYVKPGKCRLVILDVYDKVFAQPNLESTADLIQNVNENEAAVKLMFASRDIRSLNFLSVRLMTQHSPPLYEGETELYKGFRELHADTSSVSSTVFPYQTVAANLKTFSEIITYLKSVNVPFVLVSQPMVFTKNNLTHQLFLSDIKPILDKKGVDFYDLTAHSGIVSNDDYADQCHLYAEGATKYTAYLIDHIVSKIIKPESDQDKVK